MRVGEAVEAWLRSVKITLAPKTHRTYAERLRGFAEEFGRRCVARLDAEHVHEFLSHRNGHAADTQRLQIIAFEQFQKWALQQGVVRKPICPPVRKPKGKQRRRIPNEDEQRAVLELATEEFRRIFTALRITGARPGELTAADVGDYDESASLIILDDHKTASRSSQPRRIGVGYRMRDILRVEISGRCDGPIFRDERGDRWRVNQLSARYRRYRDKAGLSRELVLYAATRHEHGTRLTRELGIRAAQHSLGHASIVTTMRYDHPDDRELSRYQDRVYDF